MAAEQPDIAAPLSFRKRHEHKQGIYRLTGNDKAQKGEVQLLPSCQQSLSRYREDTGLKINYIVVGLGRSMLMHAGETGINIGTKRHWLHGASNASLALFFPHSKRGTEAMDETCILPLSKGVLCHDH